MTKHQIELITSVECAGDIVDRKRHLEADFPLKRFIQVLAVDFSPDG
ncbi:hypothetical protein [Mesorhizobium sp.]|nr:hypothetical protein [Mesorhizobium sp.]